MSSSLRENVDPWAIIDTLCEPLVDSKMPLFDALQKALPVILEQDLDSEEAKKRLSQMLKISRLLIEHLLKTQKQLVEDNRTLEEKNKELKLLKKELTKEIVNNPDWTFYQCADCSKLFVSQRFLQEHLKKRHKS